jgi:hypothetical protein
MANFLFDVEQKNRLNQNGLLKRFSIDCYGKQPTLESIRAEKSEMFTKLINKKGTPEYERWFLKYNPHIYFQHHKQNRYDKRIHSKKRKIYKKKKNNWFNRFQTRRNRNIFP